MNRLRLAAAAAILLLSSLPAAAHHGLVHEGCPVGQQFAAGDITVTGAFTRAMLPGAPAAGGYMTISNTGSSADTLTGATSEAASSLEVHTMSMVDGVMNMSALPEGLEIPAGGVVALDTRNYHLMMTGIKVEFVEGECVEVTLHFAVAGDLKVVLNIGSVAASEPPAGGHNMHDMPEHEMSSMEGM
jgi:copper(I)-binding protein